MVTATAIITVQKTSFEEVEQTPGLRPVHICIMPKYYQEDHLKPNPSKSQVSAFHFKLNQVNLKIHRKASRQVK